jgi:homoserine kinase type II
MDDSGHAVQAILSSFPAAQTAGQPVALGSAGGFSGALFWKVPAPPAVLCLRRWPREHPTPERLAYIHGVLQHIGERGLGQIPIPLRTASGETFVAREGYLWELSPWLPGKADFRQSPSPQKLANALGLLARFHLAAGSYPGAPPRRGPSPGILERLERLESLQRGGARQLADSLHTVDWPALQHLARQILERFWQLAPAAQTSLNAAARREVHLQPCLRDIWHGHLLFTGEEVTGLVDFGALREDCPAGDVARLLGSLVGNDSQGWLTGLRAYEAVRAWPSDEAALVRAYDLGNVLLSGINWLRWIFLEARQFEDRQAVLARVQEIAGRLEPGAAGRALGADLWEA